MVDREGPLVRAFVDLADTLVADYDVIELAQRLVDHCVHLLAVDAAGIMLGDPGGRLHVLASTSEQTRLLELFQVEVVGGPCLQAYRTGREALVDDLQLDSAQWQAFADRAVREGYLAVFALPMRLRGERIGAINLFRTATGPLSNADLAVARALADIATIGILQERVLSRNETVTHQLQGALDTRVIIEQAKGVLAERNGLDMDQAFGLLRKAARDNNTRLTDLARSVVDGSADSADLFGRRAT
ncbi:GAF and ANTAR domain-containing protein [Antrihabitans sp. NCIMB 15449]|uniref:GAF and ANTAR domain-containing protein n=1 Tax=Antrihabitans spumae TaxID=3373370 RepID=A0ABW7JYT5_9NOCA